MSHSRTLTREDVLGLFVELADAIAQTRLVQSGFATALTITAGGGDGLSVETPLPDEDDFRSMLMALRPLVAQGEPQNIYRVYNILDRCLSDADLVQQTRRSRERLNAEATGSDLRLMSLAPADIVDLYLHGIYFHADIRRREALARLDLEVAKVYRYFLNSYALTAIREVAVVSRIIGEARSGGLLTPRAG